MSVVAPFPLPRDRRPITAFDRSELQRIMGLYGRMVAAGHWRDYALAHHADYATFAAFRRHSERPEVRIEKRPELRLKQGAFVLVSEHGVVLKRGHDLAAVLAPLERRFMRLVR
ncbi:DUF2794 domain-containing protein [Sphingomonas sabuli]|uniref:DUF2794 domain-containing protein n=1 Tax=Sphingomonas sabuli TaxID=2764186 RepID=A0A7G9L2Y1_9SPHN|nr:DUF2794 domain-containing protein [Sphingomonas sabuli]QNM82980.1 DUF2794 domain-containing protein [Sphingomonas sabuli]